MSPLSKKKCRELAINSAEFIMRETRSDALEYTGITQDPMRLDWLYLVTASRISPKEELEPQLKRLRRIRREEHLDAAMLQELRNTSEAEDVFCSSVIQKLESGVEMGEILSYLSCQITPSVVLVREHGELVDELERRYCWNAWHANGLWSEPECSNYFFEIPGGILTCCSIS